MMPTRGFTLIETMVAVSVLALAVVGPFSSLQTALTNSYAARDQLVAASLAQEGIEFIRAKRDSNYLAGGGTDWLAGLTSCRPGPCTVDPVSGDIGGTIEPLRLVAGWYRQQGSGGEVTRFTRSISIETISANEVQVTATVEWSTIGADFSFTLTENLRDWL